MSTSWASILGTNSPRSHPGPVWLTLPKGEETRFLEGQLGPGGP